MREKNQTPQFNSYSPNLKIGFLGGGQLARMLCLEAHSLGLESHVLSSNSSDPAAQVCNQWHKGEINSVQSLKSFFKSVSLVTFESEFIDPHIIQKALDNIQKPLIYPTLDTMALCQDRLPQKELFQKHSLATSPFMSVDTKEDLELAVSKLKFPLVLKKRYGGYDGYGTFILKNQSDIKKFQPLIKKEPRGFIAEQFISFKKEVALVVARNKQGQCVKFPWVETHQENSRCLWVKGPISPVGYRKIESRINKILSQLNYVGVMGLEFFIDKKNDLIINEIAPRVHNSAHYSQNAMDVNQFQLHLKAVLGFKLSTPVLQTPGFAMLNLIGTEKNKKKKLPQWDLPPNIHPHWYRKDQNRPNRKMGHLNALGKTPQRALNYLLKHKKEFDL